MQDLDARVWQLIEESRKLPLSALQLVLLQEAVALADAHQRIDLGIAARWDLMVVARNLLRGDVLTVAFTWCLAQYDRDPKPFHGQDLIWFYQMVIGQLANLPDVPRRKLEEMLDDLGRRLRESGRSLAPVYVTRRSIAADLGDPELARYDDEALRRCRLGQGEGAFTDLRDEMETALFLGDEEKALRLGQAIVQGRRSQHSAELSADCASLLLIPLWKRGRIDEAEQLEKVCWRSFHPEQCYYWWHGELLKWLTLADKLPRAISVYEACQKAIHAYTDPLSRLHFALDAGVLFDRLRREGRRTLPLRLPEWLPVTANEGQYSVTELGDWLLQEAAELADRFDRRNGNDYFRKQRQQRNELSNLRPVGE